MNTVGNAKGATPSSMSAGRSVEHEDLFCTATPRPTTPTFSLAYFAPVLTTMSSSSGFGFVQMRTVAESGFGSINPRTNSLTLPDWISSSAVLL